MVDKFGIQPLKEVQFDASAATKQKNVHGRRKKENCAK